MRIGLDARTLFDSPRRGIGKSLLGLYRALAEVRPDWRVIAYHRTAYTGENLFPLSFMRPRRVDLRGERFDSWVKFRLPMSAWTDRVDLLHCPANHCPWWMPMPTVVTIHDLIPLDRPEGIDPAQVARFRASVGYACQKADAITCPSRYTRNRLVEQMGADGWRVRVTPWATDTPAPLQPGTDKRLRLDYDLPGPFALHFGAREPRKNTHRVIEAWALLPRHVRRTHRLLVVGLDDTTRGELAKACDTLGIDGQVKLVGYVDDTDANALLAMAQLLLYPSLSEGFGLPILEAFAAGTAVITGNATAIPEVTGHAAVHVDPIDTVAIASAMRRLLLDHALRRGHVTAGREEVTRHDWRETAETFARTLETVMGQTAPIRMAA